MMTVPETIENIRKAAERLGLAKFSARAGVPYTTARHWEKHDWRPKVIDTFAKLANAAEGIEPASDEAA